MTEAGGASRVETLLGALKELEVESHRCAGPTEAAREARAVAGDHPTVVDTDVAMPELLEGLDRVTDPWDAGVGITGVVAVAADTGTLALAASPRTPRGTSLVPPTHVALVPHGRVRDDLAGVLEALAELDPVPSGMQLITGPSRSGDIEMKLVRGVHGPGTVHVVLYPDVEQDDQER